MKVKTCKCELDGDIFVLFSTFRLHYANDVGIPPATCSWLSSSAAAMQGGGQDPDPFGIAVSQEGLACSSSASEL